jgi:signal transduction histidine kinase
MKHPATLSAMLTLYVGGGLLALGLLLGLITLQGGGRLLEQAFQDKAEALARQLATISLDALLIYDYGTLERYLNDLQAQPGVRYLSVRRADGEILGEAGIAPQGMVGVVVWPIQLGANRMGEVTVAYDVSPVREAVRGIALLGALSLMGALGLLYFWLRQVLEQRLVRPVQALADLVGASPDNPVLPWARMPEELRRVAQALVGMRAQVEKSGRQRELAERQVRAATARMCRDQRLASVGQMAAGLAHGLNTPLGNIIGYAQQARRGAADPRLLERLGVIEEQGRVCASIVRNLLDSARPPEARPHPLSLRDKLDASVYLMRPVLRDQGVELIEASGATESLIWADPACVEQVLFNLMTNAADAGAHAIHIQVEEAAQRVRLTLRDDGGGMPEAIRARLFEPFVTGKPPGKGTGLGLHICKTLLNSVGGDIELLETGPHGTVFRVTWRVVGGDGVTS